MFKYGFILTAHLHELLKVASVFSILYIGTFYLVQFLEVQPSHLPIFFTCQIIFHDLIQSLIRHLSPSYVVATLSNMKSPAKVEVLEIQHAMHSGQKGNNHMDQKVPYLCLQQLKQCQIRLSTQSKFRSINYFVLTAKYGKSRSQQSTQGQNQQFNRYLC